MSADFLEDTSDVDRVGPAQRRWSLRSLSLSTKIGFGIVLFMVVCAALAPVISPDNPNALNFGATLLPPSVHHLMGTDDNGRDILSRCLYALRLDLLVAALVTYVPLPVGVILGSIAGYFGGFLDTCISRLTDVMISFPFIVLVIAIVAIVGPGLTSIMIGIPIVSWALYARLARADMVVMRELPFMEASKALGFSTPRIIFRHGIPNLIRTSLVYSTVDLMGNLLVLAGLSYLGLGAQPPTPELGAMIAEGQPFLLNAWWEATMPGLVLVLFGLGIGMIGEGLSDGRLSGVVA